MVSAREKLNVYRLASEEDSVTYESTENDFDPDRKESENTLQRQRLSF